jgi:succinate dehydrogenase/fumarate reductase flavoprotein subunit
VIGDKGTDTRHKEDADGSDLRPFAERYVEKALRSSMYRLEKWGMPWAKTEKDKRRNADGRVRRRLWAKNGEDMKDDWEPYRSVRSER